MARTRGILEVIRSSQELLDRELRRTIVAANTLRNLAITCAIALSISIAGLASQHSNERALRFGFLAGATLAVASLTLTAAAWRTRQHQLTRSLVVAGVLNGLAKEVRYAVRAERAEIADVRDELVHVDYSAYAYYEQLLNGQADEQARLVALQIKALRNALVDSRTFSDTALDWD